MVGRRNSFRSICVNENLEYSTTLNKHTHTDMVTNIGESFRQIKFRQNLRFSRDPIARASNELRLDRKRNS